MNGQDGQEIYTLVRAGTHEGALAAAEAYPGIASGDISPIGVPRELQVLRMELDQCRADLELRLDQRFSCHLGLRSGQRPLEVLLHGRVEPPGGGGSLDDLGERAPGKFRQLLVVDEPGLAGEDRASEVDHVAAGDGVDALAQSPLDRDREADLLFDLPGRRLFGGLTGLALARREAPDQRALPEPAPGHQHPIAAGDDGGGQRLQLLRAAWSGDGFGYGLPGTGRWLDPLTCRRGGSAHPRTVTQQALHLAARDADLAGRKPDGPNEAQSGPPAHRRPGHAKQLGCFVGGEQLGRHVRNERTGTGLHDVAIAIIMIVMSEMVEMAAGSGGRDRPGPRPPEIARTIRSGGGPETVTDLVPGRRYRFLDPVEEVHE